MKNRKHWLILAFLAAMAGIVSWGIWQADRAVRDLAMADWTVVSGEVDTRWNWNMAAIDFGPTETDPDWSSLFESSTDTLKTADRFPVYRKRPLAAQIHADEN